MYRFLGFTKPVEAAFLCNILTLLMIFESLTVIQQESRMWKPLYWYLYDISSYNWKLKQNTERRTGVQNQERRIAKKFFFSEAHLKIAIKYNLKLQQMATPECTNTTRKDYPTWDLVVW